jgi:hypothetical protein
VKISSFQRFVPETKQLGIALINFATAPSEPLLVSVNWVQAKEFTGAKKFAKDNDSMRCIQ